MSLINKMLQDLDARRAGGGDGVPLEVRPLPLADNARPARQRLLGIAALTATLGAAGWWAAEQQWAPGSDAQPAPTLPRLSAAAPAMHDSPSASPANGPDAAPPAAPSAPPTAVAEAAAPVAAAPAAASAQSGATAPAAADASARAPVRPSSPSTPARAAANVDGLRLSRALLSAANDPRLAAPPNPPAASAAPTPAASRSPSAEARVEKNVRPPAPLEQAEVVYRKAVAQLGQEQRPAAVDTLRSALALDGGHASARQLLVRLLLEARQEAEALALLEDGARRYPEQVQWSLYLARILLERRGPTAALEALRQAHEPAGGSHEYRGFLAALLQQTGQHGPAIETYRQALALAPAEGRYWVGLGMAQEANGQAEAAADSYRRARGAINLPPDLRAFVDGKLR